MSAFANLLWVVRRAMLLVAVLLVAGCSSPEQKAQNYYERGMELLSKQDYVKASIEFRNAIQNKKDLVGAWRGLLEIELHNKNIQAAIPILTTIVELDPKDVDAKLKLGHFVFAGNALDRARELANAAVALDSRNPNALAFKAAVLLKLKENAQAVREAQAAIDLEPANGEAAIVLAAERVLRGDTQGALAILDRPGVTYKKDDEFPIQIFKLKIYEQSGDLKQLETTLRKLIDLYPFEAALQRSLIDLYVKQKRYDDAEKELRALSAARSSDVALGLSVVRFLEQFKGAEAARQELLSRINTSDEQKFKYQLALADFDLARGKLADSEKLLETLVNNARSSEDILAAQVKLAGIRFQEKKFDAAEELVKSILRRDGRNLDGLKLRATLRLQQGQLEQAIADLRHALDDQPRATDLMVLLAFAYERSGSIELADKQYADAIRASSFNVGVTLNYAAFLLRRGNVERAEDILTQLAQQQPNNIAVLTSLADVKLARQNWAGAEEIAKTIRQIGSNERIGDQILAAVLSGQGKYTDSIKLLEKQTDAPGAAQSLGPLVNTMIRAKKLDEAVNFLQSVLKANPDKAEAYVLLGAVQIQKNLPEQAERSFRAAIERQPKDPAAYIALASFYAQNRKIDEAEKTIRAGLKEQPDNFVMRFTYAGIMENKGDYEAAIAEYENLLKQEPGSLIAANNLASLLSDRRTDKASLDRAYSVAMVLRKSQVPSFKDTVGWLDYLRGDYKSAVSLLEEAAAALPDRAVAQYHLGVAYSAVGQAAKAAEQFRKALALSPDSSLQEKITAAQKKTANN